MTRILKHIKAEKIYIYIYITRADGIKRKGEREREREKECPDLQQISSRNTPLHLFERKKDKKGIVGIDAVYRIKGKFILFTFGIFNLNLSLSY